MANRNPLLGNRSGQRVPATGLGTTGHPASTTTPAPKSVIGLQRQSATGSSNFSQKSKARVGRRARGGFKNAGDANRSGGRALLRVMGHMVGNAGARGTGAAPRRGASLPGTPATKSATNVRAGQNRSV